MTSVFISYSHDSAAHVDRVRALADQLNIDNLDCNIDQYREDFGQKWSAWMVEQVKAADFVLVVCTPTYYRRAERKEQSGVGLGAIWESSLMTDEIYRNGTLNAKYIPVLFDEAHQAHIPTVLQGYNYYLINHEKTYYEKLYRRLTGQHETPKPLRGQPRILAPKPATGLFGGKTTFGASAGNPTPSGLDCNFVMLFAEKDKQWAERVNTHLATLRYNDIVVPFELSPGISTTDAYLDAIARVKVAMVLITPGFLGELRFYKDFLPAIEKRRDSEFKVFWLPVEPAAYEDSRLSHLTAAFEGEPLSLRSIPQQDSALVEVARNLRKAMVG